MSTEKKIAKVWSMMLAMMMVAWKALARPREAHPGQGRPKPGPGRPQPDPGGPNPGPGRSEPGPGRPEPGPGMP